MKDIKNDITKDIGRKKWYNPNCFKPIDSAIGFLLIVLLFFVLRNYVSKIYKYLWQSKIITDYYFLENIATVVTEGLLAIVAIIYARIRRVTLFSGDKYYTKMSGNDVVVAIMLILGIYLCLSPLHTSFYDDMTQIFGNLGLSTSQELIESSSFISILLYEFVFCTIFPAVCEELAFRGIVFRGLEKQNAFAAVIISSILFAIMHGSVGMIILQFIGGIAIASVVCITKNHYIGVIMHFTNNLFTVVCTIVINFGTVISQKLGNLNNAFLTILGIIFLVISIYYFIKKYMGIYKHKILGTEKSSYKEGDREIVYTERDLANIYYTTRPYDFDDSKMIKDENTMFLYKKKFIGYNKKSSNIATFIIFAISISICIINLFI